MYTLEEIKKSLSQAIVSIGEIELEAIKELNENSEDKELGVVLLMANIVHHEAIKEAFLKNLIEMREKDGK